MFVYQLCWNVNTFSTTTVRKKKSINTFEQIWFSIQKAEICLEIMINNINCLSTWNPNFLWNPYTLPSYGTKFSQIVFWIEFPFPRSTQVDVMLICVKAVGLLFTQFLYSFIEKIDWCWQNHCTIFVPDYDLYITWSNKDLSSLLYWCYLFLF